MKTSGLVSALGIGDGTLSWHTISSDEIMYIQSVIMNPELRSTMEAILGRIMQGGILYRYGYAEYGSSYFGCIKELIDKIKSRSEGLEESVKVEDGEKDLKSCLDDPEHVRWISNTIESGFLWMVSYGMIPYTYMWNESMGLYLIHIPDINTGIFQWKVNKVTSQNEFRWKPTKFTTKIPSTSGGAGKYKIYVWSKYRPEIIKSTFTFNSIASRLRQPFLDMIAKGDWELDAIYFASHPTLITKTTDKPAGIDNMDVAEIEQSIGMRGNRPSTQFIQASRVDNSVNLRFKKWMSKFMDERAITGEPTKRTDSITGRIIDRVVSSPFLGNYLCLPSGTDTATYPSAITDFKTKDVKEYWTNKCAESFGIERGTLFGETTKKPIKGDEFERQKSASVFTSFRRMLIDFVEDTWYDIYQGLIGSSEHGYSADKSKSIIDEGEPKITPFTDIGSKEEMKKVQKIMETARDTIAKWIDYQVNYILLKETGTPELEIRERLAIPPGVTVYGSVLELSTAAEAIIQEQVAVILSDSKVFKNPYTTEFENTWIKRYLDAFVNEHWPDIIANTTVIGKDGINNANAARAILENFKEFYNNNKGRELTLYAEFLGLTDIPGEITQEDKLKKTLVDHSILKIIFPVPPNVAAEDIKFLIDSGAVDNDYAILITRILKGIPLDAPIGVNLEERMFQKDMKKLKETAKLKAAAGPPGGGFKPPGASSKPSSAGGGAAPSTSTTTMNSTEKKKPDGESTSSTTTTTKTKTAPKRPSESSSSKPTKKKTKTS